MIMTTEILVEQEWNKEGTKRALQEWVEYWSEGDKWGIVGGNKLRSSITPNTVIEQARMHGKAIVSRDGNTAFKGMSDLVTSIEKLIEGAITQPEIDEFYQKHKDLKELLQIPHKNPQNIEFHTVIEFSEPVGEDDEPIITRGKVFGHYRTLAYNEYALWMKDNKPEKKNLPKFAKTKAEWYSDEPEAANPPLLQCIANKDHGLLAVVRKVDKAIGGPKAKNIKHKKGTIGKFPVLGKPPAELANISTMREHIETILNDPSIYPGGKSRAPVKQRLNDAFNNMVFTADSQDIQILENLFIDFKEMPGHENLKQFRLYFPKSNITINKLIRAVMGEDLDTFQKPGTIPEEVKPGLTLKMQDKPKNWMGVLKS
jgi:hypothetical protein